MKEDKIVNIVIVRGSPGRKPRLPWEEAADPKGSQFGNQWSTRRLSNILLWWTLRN